MVEKETETKIFSLKSAWVFTTVFGAGLIAFGALKENGFFITEFVKVLVALTTGFWYWARYSIYSKILTPKKMNLANIIFFIIISFLATTSILWVNFEYWFMLQAAVFLLGAEKCAEIIFYQRKILKLQDKANYENAKNKVYSLIFVQYNSIIRDTTWVFWWILYGIFIKHSNISSDIITMLFGIPYILLAMSSWYNAVKGYNVKLFYRNK